MTEEELRNELKELVDLGGEVGGMYEWGTSSVKAQVEINEVKDKIVAAFNEMLAENAEMLEALKGIIDEADCRIKSPATAPPVALAASIVRIADIARASIAEAEGTTE